VLVTIAVFLAILGWKSVKKARLQHEAPATTQ
jgi:hypothetical protein